MFVLPFVLVLIVLGLLVFAIALRFQTIMSRLEVTRSLWPMASQELGPRYDRFSGILAPVFSNESVRQEWEKSRQEFQVSSQFDRQSYASTIIEKQIQESIDKSQSSSSDFEKPGISKLLDAERLRKESQDDFIGWVTVQALRLKLPPIYDPRVGNQR